jgi:hypothetical protein
VTMVHLAILPNWNSLDSVRAAHSDLEAAGIVFFALLVVMEALAHRSKDERRKHRFDSIGIWFFAIAIACEVVGYWYGQRNDDLSRGVISSLDTASKEAFAKASDAKTVAQGAATIAGAANKTSGEAQQKASSALNLAAGARSEADEFKDEIVSANQKAASAESHLADALERAANAEERTARAEAEIARLKSPRSMGHTDKLIAALKPFKKTEFTLSTFADSESMNFTRDIAIALGAAGWIRKQPASINIGVPTFGLVFEGDTKENVPECVETGVSIHVPTKETPEALNSSPPQYRPKIVLAGATLRSALSLSISPENDQNVAPGIIDNGLPEGPISICVGKKP